MVNFHINPDGTRVGYTRQSGRCRRLYELYEVTLPPAPGTAQGSSAPMKKGWAVFFEYSADSGR